MEEASTFPSLPPNFVSLQKLQEQRLQEQEQKKKQQQQQERRLKQEEERNKKAQVEEIKTITNGFHRKDKRRPPGGGRGQVGSRSPGFVEIRTMPDGLSRRNRQSEKSMEPKKLEEEEIKTTEEPTDLEKPKAERSEKSANSKSQEPNKVEEEDKEIKITEEPTDLEKLRKKKTGERKKEWKMKKGERKQKLKLKEVGLTDCSSGNAAGDRSTEENLPSLNLTVEIGVVDESKKKVESGKEVNGERSEGGKWGRRKKTANPTAEVVQRMGDISVNGDDEKMSRRSTVEMNGGFRGGRSWNPGRRVRRGGGGVANLMWMKKDEITQSNGHY